ncbi:MAG TPA: SDR family oxidoreductase [Vicinamibacterales bacterium]|nr:SDR family oxidoreductase [Vicinamibacterales bacterium]
MIDRRDLYHGKVVLVSGRAGGIELSTARCFAAHGAHVIEAHGDAGSADTRELIVEIGGRFGRIDAFVAHGPAISHVEDECDEREFLETLRLRAWPTFGYLAIIKKLLGQYPKYVVSVSSGWPDEMASGSGLAAASDSVVAALIRQLACKLRSEGVRMNLISARTFPRQSDTEAGDGFSTFLRRVVPEHSRVTADDVAQAVFALCSGMFDALTGQVVVLDRGATFAEGISYLYDRRDAIGFE